VANVCEFDLAYDQDNEGIWYVSAVSVESGKVVHTASGVSKAAARNKAFTWIRSW
jgi:hypothetical protein